ncbi:DUF2797 domain-containing protein [Aequorivita sp. SDUM287046]|uniref:DUF2797 domain-containing protein n=1 Tax=Aequorivita aurantiaca TaxID=3053356 RepID=A0ABT8DMM0_9FLAO|nr:DUF2797 domain-containing protein [Aequorivita aurantiaca]MDN3725226.1 DUF2797 domain-containing protein [Aequorivita aurantiaca]
MIYEGMLTKMLTENGSPIQYYLVFDNDFLSMNQLLDKKISINFLRYQCLHCSLQKKIYRQGYCYNCFFLIPQAADWIINPELSKAHLGIEVRELAYEIGVQLQPHVVYLANSSSVKVGVTRKSQIPTRWIDQGAHEAIEIVEVPNRYLAGITEVALKSHVSDKTNWRAMLKNDIKDENLAEWRNQLQRFIPEEAREYFLEHNLETNLQFPVLKYPSSPKSLNLIKSPYYEGILKGIKGQYLIFDDDTVFNVRGNEGCVISIAVN